MKTSVLAFLGIILLFTVGPAGADPTPVPTPPAKKVIAPAKHSGKAGKLIGIPSTRPNLYKIARRISSQWQKITEAMKAGRITQTESGNLREGIKNTRKQQYEFMKQNGRQDLTDDQLLQLEKMLDENGKAVGDTGEPDNASK